MTNEEKQLLLTDLCGRLPYGVKCQIDFGEPIPGAYVPEGYDRYMDDRIICVYPETFEFGTNDLDMFSGAEEIKPYLRPLSSMIKKEIANAAKTYFGGEIVYTNINDKIGFYSFKKDRNPQYIYFDDFSWKLGQYGFKNIDWLNEHHFDYRGLIEKGLAIEAPEGMYEF